MKERPRKIILPGFYIPHLKKNFYPIQATMSTDGQKRARKI